MDWIRLLGWALLLAAVILFWLAIIGVFHA
jgi:hypothetical protein